MNDSGTRIGNLSLTGPVIAAPMSGITDLPFRLLAKSFGAALAYIPLISAKALCLGSQKTIDLLVSDPAERPVAVQVFGGSSETIAGAVSILTTHPVDMIDINMGCPVAKVLKSGGGAVLMRDVGLAREIIQAAVETSDIPVTIKMRAGWDADSINAPELAAIAQDSGAAAVAVHPRIKTQGFTGHADWTLIAEIKKQLNIPVIGSGDVRSPDDAKRMREETGCNFVMIGRAARGNPWIFRRTTTLLHEGVLLPEPSPVERLRVLRSHCALLAKLEGDLRTARKMRKHAAWYIKGLKNAAIARQKVNRAESVNEIMEVCRLLEEEWHEACK